MHREGAVTWGLEMLDSKRNVWTETFYQFMKKRINWLIEKKKKKRRQLDATGYKFAIFFKPSCGQWWWTSSLPYWTASYLQYTIGVSVCVYRRNIDRNKSENRLERTSLPARIIAYLQHRPHIISLPGALRTWHLPPRPWHTPPAAFSHAHRELMY